MSEKIISPGVFQNESDQSLVQRGIEGTATAIVGPTVLGQPFVPTYVTSYSEFQSKFGTTFKSGSYYYEYLTSIAAREYFQNGGQTLLVTRIVSGSANVSTYSSAGVLNLTSSLSTGSTNAFTIETLAWGSLMNNTSSISSGALASGSATNVRWEVTNVNTGSGVFTLAIRRGDDNTAQPNYLETWPNLSLDPSLPNYVSRVIGDQKPVYRVDSDGNPYIDITGSYANASQYIRIASVIAPQIDSIDNNGNYKASQYGFTLPATGSGSYGGSFSGGVVATNVEQKMNENISTSNMEGFAVADYNTALALLTNQDEYRFNVLLAPAVGLDSAASTTVISTVEGRGDAFAPISAGVYGTSITSATNTAAGQSSNYAATYYPWIQLYNSNLGKNVWCPSTTVIGGVLAFNDQVGAEWFAPAGLNRGGVPSVLRAERKLSQADRDKLYSANVNPLATFPGEGVVVFGQKTLQRRQTSLDRVNVRRLLISLKDFIGQVGNNLVFEQNTNATRNRFLAQVNPYLESVVQRQGLYAYKVVMDDTNNTPDVIDRNQLVGQIYIQPTKTAEFIILNFNVLPTGATFPA
jgi:phage tail sheath protein FI